MMNRPLDCLIPITIGQAQAKIEFPDSLIDDPHAAILGIALVAHPHPLMGGTMENKVAVTLAKTLNKLGFVTVRFNFRGVDQSTGVHDHGIGETEDLREILARVRTPAFWQSLPDTQDGSWVPQVGQLPYVLAGFSFGTFVSSRLVASMTHDLPKKLILVGSACGKWAMPDVPGSGSAARTATRLSSLPAARRRSRMPSWMVAMPEES